MDAADATCAVVLGLIGRWHDGDMDERDRDAYEQHLLFCPPCREQSAKTRRLLAALARVGAQEPDAAFVRELAAGAAEGERLP